jgi:hypothetical protein
MAIKIDRDRPNVILIWLVTVNVYGIIPKRLLASIKKNRVNINGKYFVRSVPVIFSCDTPNINEYISSATDCHLYGTTVLFAIDSIKNSDTVRRTISIKSDEFVNEISI